MPLTYTGKGGVPYMTKEEAAASYGSSSSSGLFGGLTVTDRTTGQIFSSDRERILAQEERRKRGW